MNFKANSQPLIHGLLTFRIVKEVSSFINSKQLGGCRHLLIRFPQKYNWLLVNPNCPGPSSSFKKNSKTFWVIYNSMPIEASVEFKASTRIWTWYCNSQILRQALSCEREE